jgi:hypothetical protein
MEWLTNNGQVYHRACTGWSASVESGKCEQCGNAIPAETLRLARDQMDDRMRAARRREVQQRTAAVTRKFAEMQARTEAKLRRAAPGADEPRQKG